MISLYKVKVLWTIWRIHDNNNNITHGSTRNCKKPSAPMSIAQLAVEDVPDLLSLAYLTMSLMMDLSEEIVKLKSNQVSSEARATGQDTSATVDGGATDHVRNINDGCSTRYSSSHSGRQNDIITRPIISDSYQHVNTVTFGDVCAVSASNMGETRRKILFQHISDTSWNGVLTSLIVGTSNA